MVHHSEVLKRFKNIFIKIVFKKNSPNCFFAGKGFSINWISKTIDWMWQLFLLQLEYNYFCYNWNLWLGQLTVNSIDWMVCSINWTVTAKLFLKLIWVFKGMGIIIFSNLRLSKSTPWDFLSEIEHPFCAIILW